jgi:2-(1,2-epoxy-1,2-dihydrophenyl)acetyl-CoA isomerase
LVTIRLNRPDAFNALNEALLVEMLNAVIEVDVDPEARALLITGNGQAFSGGGDVKAFVEAGDGLSALVHRMTVNQHGMVSRLIRMQKPVITAVNGIAAGAGLALAMAGDIVLAVESAKFTSAYTRIGASPDGSSTFFLSRLVGIHRAMELVYTNRVLSADEAMEWGMVSRVLSEKDFLQEATTFAEGLANGPTLAFGKSKDLLYHSQNHDLEAQMERETQFIVASTKTEDFRTATQAFIEKKTPVYKGR